LHFLALARPLFLVSPGTAPTTPRRVGVNVEWKSMLISDAGPPSSFSFPTVTTPKINNPEGVGFSSRSISSRLRIRREAGSA
jgi:hypothetical protein